MENFDLYSTREEIWSVTSRGLFREIPKPGMFWLTLRRFDLQLFFHRGLHPLQHFIFG